MQMVHGVPEFIPPKWLDQEQKPMRNTTHNLPTNTPHNHPPNRNTARPITSKEWATEARPISRIGDFHHRQLHHSEWSMHTDHRHLDGSLAFRGFGECSPAGRTRSRRVTTGS
jgi:hypothetical protein